MKPYIRILIRYIMKKQIKQIVEKVDFSPKLKKKVLRVYLETYARIFIDTEYYNETTISVQAYIRLYLKNECFFEKKIILLNKNYKVSELIIKEALNKDIQIIYCSFDNSSKNNLFEQLTKLLIENNFIQIGSSYNMRVYFYYFYQISDLWRAVGYKNVEPYFLKNIPGINYKRRVTGNIKLLTFIDQTSMFFTIFLNDISGLETLSLRQMVESIGISTEDKDLMDFYKFDMRKAILEKPYEFLIYGMNDAYVLFKIIDVKIQSFNEIMVEVYNLPLECCFTWFNFPLTLGSIINHIWKNYIKYIIKKDSKYVHLAFVKQGDLNTNSKTYTINLSQFQSISNLNSKVLFKEFSENQSYKELLGKDVCIAQPHQKASLQYIISNSNGTSAIYNTLRTGGRSVNEFPTEYFCEYILDVDISQAYGSQLKQGIYPFGRPRFYSTTSNQDQITLKEFLFKYRAKLQKYNLFKIVVSGDLKPFECDLLLSKVFSKNFTKTVLKKFNPLQPYTAEFSTDTVLLRQELHYSTITARILEVLEKVSTTQEINKIYDLKVVTAMYWLDSDAVDSIEELADFFVTDRGKVVFDNNQQVVSDKRSFKWFPFQLKNFIEPLTDKRENLKNKKDSNSKALNKSLKDCINTFYGIITSSYFDINNVVVSDIITANVRVAVWLLAKALKLRICVTDGGFFSPVGVYYLKKSFKKPGLTTLSRYQYMDNNKSIKIAPLNNILNWPDYYNQKLDPFTQFPSNLNEMIKKHVESFWEVYNIKFFDNLEVKVENCSIKASYFLKTHYMLLRWNALKKDYTDYFKKIRGVRSSDISQNYYVNPIYYLLKAMLDKKTHFKFQYQYYSTRLLSLPQFQMTLKREEISKYLEKPKDTLKNSRYKSKKYVANSRTSNKTKKLYLKKLFNLEKEIKSKVFKTKTYILQPKVKPYITTSKKKPGDFVENISDFRLNNTHCYILNLKDYSARTRRGKAFKSFTSEDNIYRMKNLQYEFLFFVKSIDEVVSIINHNKPLSAFSNIRKQALEIAEEQPIDAFHNNNIIDTTYDEDDDNNNDYDHDDDLKKYL